MYDFKFHFTSGKKNKTKRLHERKVYTKYEKEKKRTQ